ncbi:phytoene/squalene synthase family protein [Cytophaga aurantiaca]|uniref:phytoene/squalene synthase family protein n=1 Tax=Cytophaga aurantiaca TaxID=29530 RepID=UPI000376285A|nr:phytoene/squalene synthase family protein [Cytophaga aurantiaca]
MKHLFDNVSAKCSKLTTKEYSTSFSLGIYFLHKKIHDPIYAIYGFVRFADEIVDSFHGYDKKRLMQQFRNDTVTALEDKISLNPILNSFQKVVHDYNIEWELIDTFLKSMEMDLEQSAHDQESYKEYIVGSAEVVGLMCLHVFVKGDATMYEKQKPYAMSLGSAFQKVNFLRDAKEDFDSLGRTYFPDVSMKNFDQKIKKSIESDIEKDFQHALIGIKELPSEARLGVYLAYIYYQHLFNKIKSVPAERILKERIRIPNLNKFGLLFQCYLRNQLNIL